ncbi:hypothetical protein QTP81_02670 [Alteromonas sp. ASW11-36]|uniref:Uncharacterized protein n=1 Tax=Alteromonas arenosi TaxID=3055817 RepID=A0ABT7STI5_9ALTE|nr:hypothetical protein [Alteromonas sp. ASW11-36]MDM7859508.1 hypothetical protein [Alteromonas sp. ASW11-36]
MLILSILFTSVSLLLIYSLMRDTGRNTPHARQPGLKSDGIKTNNSQQQDNTEPSSIVGLS